jgi:hypothetical protein
MKRNRACVDAVKGKSVYFENSVVYSTPNLPLAPSHFLVLLGEVKQVLMLLSCTIGGVEKTRLSPLLSALHGVWMLVDLTMYSGLSRMMD